MSTFKGIIKEFPQIRIDYFRRVHDEVPPLACFLSHVHSDHLSGLESLKAPFVYCSPATREILLRLEKYPHRMNFAKGILESRVQTYRHLKSLLKTIPLETPTIIELSPGYEIRVTLFDSNHCVGAVMFLIEGQGRSVLYTGDIRSEAWWVHALVQNPILLPYAECTKTLDCIYLDTTFASKTDQFKIFPGKADGLKELVQKVSQYPADTIFYMEAWTFGYENVWIALSSLLDCQVHLDSYRWSLYKSLAHTPSGAPVCDEASQLYGFQLGNHRKQGCLTSENTSRLHSCEKGTSCPVIRGCKSVVRIIPIVSRLANGSEMYEVGIGGGKGDLDQTHELELHDAAALGALMQLCAAKVDDKNMLLQIFSLLNSGRVHLDLDFNTRSDGDEVKLEELVEMLSTTAMKDKTKARNCDMDFLANANGQELSRTITFPYSRHSSYSELCCLVEAFRPKDIHPCTVDEEQWTPELSMRALFGHLCSDTVFEHDSTMHKLYKERNGRSDPSSSQLEQETQRTLTTIDTRSQGLTEDPENTRSQLEISERPTSAGGRFPSPVQPRPSSSIQPAAAPVLKALSPPHETANIRKHLRSPSPIPDVPSRNRKIRKWAYLAAIGMDSECDSWDAFGGLACVGRQKYTEEEL